jgi:hypothetical protein
MAEVIEIGKDGAVRREATHREKRTQRELEQKGRFAELPDDQLSPARRRLRKLAKTDKPRITKIEIRGEDWFIRALRFAELTKLGLLTSRNGSGVLDLMDTDAITSLVTAMLYVAVAADEFDSADYFGSLSEAREWAESTDEEIGEVVTQLFLEIRRINPSIVPTGDEAGEAKITPQEAEAREKKDESAQSEGAVSEPFTMPPSASETTGSTLTASIAEPASSPSGEAS